MSTIGSISFQTVLEYVDALPIDDRELLISLIQKRNLNTLYSRNNQFKSLPDSIINLHNLSALYLDGNSLNDLEVLQSLKHLTWLSFLDVNLSRKYWIKFQEWEPKWLLDELNVEIRSRLIQQVGYERICQELNAREISHWREYSLLKIDGVEPTYDDYQQNVIDREPMLLLKMTCPSTNHIHILRVPPDMTSAEEAITWVNHGIHPDGFAIET